MILGFNIIVYEYRYLHKYHIFYIKILKNINKILYFKNYIHIY